VNQRQDGALDLGVLLSLCCLEGSLDPCDPALATEMAAPGLYGEQIRAESAAPRFGAD
jgi:hypothetical protein